MSSTASKALAATILTVCIASACNGEDEKMSDKEAYEKVIAEIGERVALISAYRPHLDKPKPQKYDPEKRTDLDRAAQYAANEIRHAANGASQKVAKIKSTAVAPLGEVLANVAKACAEVEGDEEVGKCRDMVATLDAALQEHAGKASSAGVSAKFPRVGPEHITDEAKKGVALFIEARGPGPQEVKYLDARRDLKVTPNDLVMLCDTMANEAEVTMDKMEATGDAEIRKVAAHHKAAVDGQCNRLKDAAALVTTIDSCKQIIDKGDKMDDEMDAACRLACSKIRGRVERGIPTAGLERLEKDYEEACEDYEKERQDNEKKKD